ncbi:RlpA-like double-psi beta-barrel-protein domain-containing protein-containing protein [Lanmaoa asiatica]|nr:RlpA-like double-psi beta-barrel-protein domain-containing protein-containing protein [Lanmaoa asiatica]
MFSYLIVAFFAVLAVPSYALPRAASAALTTVSDASSNGPFTGGFATYYYQNGNAGACGHVNPDSALIGAMGMCSQLPSLPLSFSSTDQARFGTSGSASPLCGKQVQITNTNNGQKVTITIADDCPTCDNANSIDLSVDAFQAISDLSAGCVPISWVYV